jgi:CarboxypepD_reg-like domain
MRRLFYTSLFLVIYNLSFGQIEITVRVVDRETKKPIKNANVVILGTTKGTFTNALGFFKLELTRGQKKIVISHVSYVTEPIDVPENVNSFSVPLRKTDFMFPLDLKEYPSKFDTTKIKKKEVKKTNHGDESWMVVEALADYPGGLQGFMDYFGNNFKYPESELLKNANGVTRLEFTIDKTGDYKKIRCLPDSVGEICDEFKRILTVIPKWIPAEQRGEKIDQEMAFPIWYGPNDYWKKKLKEIKKNKG